MFRHLAVAALRDLARNPVQSVIAIGGLVIGLTAAILAGIITANQYSYDHFIPGSGQIYYTCLETHGAPTGKPNGQATTVDSSSPLELAKYLHQDIPEIAITRLQLNNVHLRHGDIEAKEDIYWADPNVFQLLPLPVLYGSLDKALARPDGIVIPRAIAEKYFGRDNVVGETLQLERQHIVTVTAVIADLPINATTLHTGIFASGQASFSTMAIEYPFGRLSIDPGGGWIFFDNSVTLVRISPHMSLNDLHRRATAMVDSFEPRSDPERRSLRFIPMDRMHVTTTINLGGQGVQRKLIVLDTVGLIILFLACVNFVNLTTARAAWRGVEIGIRKVTGAARPALIAQLLGESVLQALAALMIALVLVEWTLPALNNFLVTGAVLNYWNALLVGALLSGTLLVGILAGFYPALVISSFRPVAVLKGLASGFGGAAIVRQVLVTAQFAILISLLIATGVVFLQDRYATKDALRLDTDQMLVVTTHKCQDAFKTQVAALPGVRGVACSDDTFMPGRGGAMEDAAELRGGGHLDVSLVSVGYGLFELYGLKPLAGRFFSADRGDDAIPNPAATDFTAHYVLNETAVRKMGFGSPQAALGQTVKFVPFNVRMGFPEPNTPAGSAPQMTLRGTVVGVVQDFAMTSGDKEIDPTVYSVGIPMSGASRQGSGSFHLLSVKLNGRNIPETLAAIDSLWHQIGNKDPVTGSAVPINRTFVDAYIASLEIEVLREAEALAVFAGIAMFLGCLGLFGLSLSATKRRIKEIGIRKAMGATSADIVILMLWQFSKPVLWASLLAWPLAYLAMHHWLTGFAHHVDVQAWLFLAASLINLTVAVLTVAGQSILVAREKPVLALRYE